VLMFGSVSGQCTLITLAFKVLASVIGIPFLICLLLISHGNDGKNSSRITES